MAEVIAGQSLAGGWTAEVVRLDQTGPEFVTDKAELVRAVFVWLDLQKETGFERDDLADLIEDGTADQAQDPDYLPMWKIPLNVDRLAELVTNGRQLQTEFDVDGVRYQIEIDYSDF